MNNNKWITDRLPTKKEAADDYGLVWITDKDGRVSRRNWMQVELGMPWTQAWDSPEPYMKPKRWCVVWSELYSGWTLREYAKGGCVPLFDSVLRVGLIDNTDEHREAAERIAAIYEEVVP